MKTSDLKKIIKQLVKESLQEILLEEYIAGQVKKALNENVQLVAKQQKSFSQNLKESVAKISEPEMPSKNIHEAKQIAELEQKRKEVLRKSFGGSSVMTEIFEDTMKNGKNSSSVSLPVASNGDDSSGIPEETLAALGAFGNWEKYIK